MFILNILEKIAGILLSIVSVVGIIYGIIVAQNYKSKLIEKHRDSIFNFYSRLKVYLRDFLNRLGRSPEKNILVYKYRDDSLRDLEDFRKPKDDEVKSFVDFILDFINFLKNTENQIPLDKSFHIYFEQFKKILFDLTNLAGMATDVEYNDNEPARNEFNIINSLVDKLLCIIEKEQCTILGYNEKTKEQSKLSQGQKKASEISTETIIKKC